MNSNEDVQRVFVVGQTNGHSCLVQKTELSTFAPRAFLAPGCRSGSSSLLVDTAPLRVASHLARSPRCGVPAPSPAGTGRLRRTRGRGTRGADGRRRAADGILVGRGGAVLDLPCF